VYGVWNKKQDKMLHLNLKLKVITFLLMEMKKGSVMKMRTIDHSITPADH